MTLLLDDLNNPDDLNNLGDLNNPDVPDSEEPMFEDPSPRWGRRILLGFGALGLVVGATVSAIAIPHLDDGTGDRTYHPTTFAAVEHS